MCLWSPAPAQQLEGVDDDNDDDNDDDDDYYYFAKLTDLLRTVVTIDSIVSDTVNLGLTGP